MRKSFALFITLAIVAAVAAVVYLNLKSIDSYSKRIDSEISFIQFNKNILDIEKILKNSLVQIEDKDSLELLYSVPVDINQSIEIGSFSISFAPLCNKINLNLLYENKKENKQIEKIVRQILDYFGVEYPDFFIDILLDTLDEDRIERSVDSEIANKFLDFNNGHIYNYKQLQFLVDYYATITEDKNIYSVPFKEIFGFQCEGMGYYFMSPILKKLLFDSDQEIEFKTIQQDFNETVSILNMKEYMPVIKIDIIKNGCQKAEVIYDLRIQRYIESYVSW